MMTYMYVYLILHNRYRHLDFVSIMAYDLHGVWENVTVHHSPLYMRSNDTEKGMSVVWMSKRDLL